MKIPISFKKEFREAMLNGTKTMTSRTRQFGNEGDTFEAFGATFEMILVLRLPLLFSAEHWKEEGCRSQEDFIHLWEVLHPWKGYDPHQFVFVHQFKRLKDLGNAGVH